MQDLIRVDRAPSRPDQPSLAERLGVSNKTAWRLVRDGAVESVLIRPIDPRTGDRSRTGRRMVVNASVDAYIARGGDK